jgi:hypothetical protein
MMGLFAGLTAGQALLASTAISTGVGALGNKIASNKAGDGPKLMGAQQLAPPKTGLDDDIDDEVNLGSDRAKKKGERNKGRRQLMAPQATQAPTGLQI